MSGRQKRVVHFWEDYFPGQFVEPHRHMLDDENWDSLVIAGRGVNADTSDMPGVVYYSKRTLRAWRERTLAGRIRDRLARPFFWRGFNRYCAVELARVGPAVLHLHFGTTAVRLLPMLQHNRSPAVVTFYGVDASAALRQRHWVDGYRALFKRVSRLIVLCEGVKRRFVDLGCSAEKLVVWNLPAGIEQYPYTERRAGERVRFLIAARFAEKKGYRYLLEAFKALLEGGRKASLTIIGYGSMGPRLVQQIEAMGLSTSVTLIDTEARRDFPEIYRRALESHDIFILPSTTAANGDDEGGPALTMVCAQHSGLPVICTPFPGAEITVVDPETGLYCRQDDAFSLRERMEYLMDRPQLWAPMGKAGSERVASRFSVVGQMRRLTDLYESLQ